VQGLYVVLLSMAQHHHIGLHGLEIPGRIQQGLSFDQAAHPCRDGEAVGTEPFGGNIKAELGPRAGFVEETGQYVAFEQVARPRALDQLAHLVGAGEDVGQLFAVKLVDGNNIHPRPAVPVGRLFLHRFEIEQFGQTFNVIHRFPLL